MSVKRHKHRRLSRLELTLSPMTKLATDKKGKPHRRIIGAAIRDGRRRSRDGSSGLTLK